MNTPPENHQTDSDTSATRFRWVIAAGALLVCVLVAILLLQDNTLPIPSPDPTSAMLAAIKPDRSAPEPITPLPKRLTLDQRKVALGRELFSDRRLSRDNTVSCATCHNPARSGMDGQEHSFGIGGAQSERNSPTVFNSGFNFRQFWDGRVITLEDQIDGPIGNPRELGSNWKQIMAKLSADEVYQRRFAESYPNEGLSPANIRDALATFERALVTPDAPFDRWLRGEGGAISPQAREGYALFKSYGCISCHNGANVGGNMFERIGLAHDFFADRGKNTDSDQGVFILTNMEEDRHEFRVPSLRNVELTAPYFHDGSVKTLRKAITLMAYYQLGVRMPDQDAELIEAFLHSLTGKLPEALK